MKLKGINSTVIISIKMIAVFLGILCAIACTKEGNSVENKKENSKAKWIENAFEGLIPIYI